MEQVSDEGPLGSLHGLEKARASFIKGSDYWEMAYAFATGVDITFVSNHGFLHQRIR